MNDIKDIIESLNYTSEQISIPFVILNFLICIVVSTAIKSYYTRFSNSLTGKSHIGTVIPMLAGIVFIVIVIIKSSLALSLGLVGALSIVRFRTPIKEPEELAYLFLSISVGLGYGAGFTLITTILVFLILTCNYLLSYRKMKVILEKEYTLVYESSSLELKFDELINNIKKYSDNIKFIRVDSQKQKHVVVLLITFTDNNGIDDLLKLNNDSNSVSIFEANTNW